ncbi:MAG: phosphotransferase [Candidatus Obscuribacterales bacterium]
MSLKSETFELLEDRDFLDYLRRNCNALSESQGKASLEDLGGNINRVRRVTYRTATGEKASLIVKHVPRDGQLARYPAIKFCDRRLDREHDWYQWCHQIPGPASTVKVPDIIHYDREKRVMVMEDLGKGTAFDSLLRRTGDKKNVLGNLGSFLGSAHRASLSSTVPLAEDNEAARQNRRYVFTMHVKEPDTVSRIWHDIYGKHRKISLASRIALKDEYLDKYSGQISPVLEELENTFKTASRGGGKVVYTHGDLHTRSIIVSPVGAIGIIDAELSDYGNSCFDLGIFGAHLWAHSISQGTPRDEVLKDTASFLGPYSRSFDPGEPVPDRGFLADFVQHAGAEMLRRLLGPAGFNTDLSRETFSEMLITATDLLLDGDFLVTQLLEAIEQERIEAL